MLLLVHAALALSILVFAPGLLEQFESPKAMVVRVCGVCLLAAALASGRGLRRQPWLPLDWAVLVWLGAEALATLFSVAPRLSLFGEQEQREGLLTSLGLAGLYLGARSYAREPRRVSATLAVLIGGAVAASAYALIQAARLDPVPWTRTATLGETLRPFGTLGHPNLLGVVTAPAAVAAAALALHGGFPRRLYAAAAALLAAATLFTFSRGAWLGLAAGLAAGGALALRARAAGRFSPRALAIGAGIAVVAIVAVMAAGWGGVFAARFRELLSPTGGSGRSRLEIWGAALAAWQARPWLGHGPDAFGLVYPHFQTAAYWRYEWAGLPGHAHSIYLHALATRGVLGAVAGGAWLVGLALVTGAAWRAGGERRALAAALAGVITALGVAGAVGALGAAGAVVLVLASALLAAVAAPAPDAQPQGATRAEAAEARRKERKRAGGGTGARRRPARARGAWSPGIAGSAVAAVMLAASVRDFMASREVALVRAAIKLAGEPGGAPQAERWAQAAAKAASASALLPYDDWGPRLRAEALLALSAASPTPDRVLADAEAAAREAVRRMPLRALGHQRLGSVLAARAARGDRAAAAQMDAAFARAVELAPMNPFALVEWSRSRLRLGRVADAVEPARRAATLYPDDALAQSMLAAAYLTLGDRAAGRAALERAVAGNWHGSEAERARTEQLLRSLQ